MSLYRLFTAAAVSTDSAASIDIREDGVIETLQIASNGLAGASGATVDIELSFAPVSSFATNDTTQVIATAAFATPSATAVPWSGNMNAFKDVKVNAGDRIYTHVRFSSAPTNSRVWIGIDVKDSISGKRTASRR